MLIVEEHHVKKHGNIKCLALSLGKIVLDKRADGVFRNKTQSVDRVKWLLSFVERVGGDS
jgi:hypothetical protein